jgi:Calcineurin-like phosphoesterase
MDDLRDKEFFHQQFGRVVEHLEQVVDAGAATVRGAKASPQLYADMLKAARQAQAEAGEPDGGAYYSRHPVVSLAQSALQQRREDREKEEMGDPFTKADIGWVVEIGLSLLWRLLHDRHPFCDEPATAALEDNARLVLVGDWGTGQEGAKRVAEAMRPWIERTDRPVHVIHLGDVYYSGLEREVRDHFLRLWPVREDEKDSVSSWALNGNHDMYSGGRGFFDTLLVDPRFQRQRAANGAPTSWFALQSEHWDVVGLDTAWNDHLPFEWTQGHLHGGQADLVAARAADPQRRLLLLSHHQLFTISDDNDVGKPIAKALRPTLDGDGIDVWFWGHEHDCVAYHPHAGVRAARAIGHGAVPELAAAAPADPPSFLQWRYNGYRVGADDGLHWAKHGFAVLDLDGERLTAHYVDDEGEEHHSPESLPPA